MGKLFDLFNQIKAEKQKSPMDLSKLKVLYRDLGKEFNEMERRIQNGNG